MVVGHSVTDNLFGAERSLLDVLAAVDRRTFDLSCVLPGGNADYLRSAAECRRNRRYRRLSVEAGASSRLPEWPLPQALDPQESECRRRPVRLHRAQGLEQHRRYGT